MEMRSPTIEIFSRCSWISIDKKKKKSGEEESEFKTKGVFQIFLNI